MVAPAWIVVPPLWLFPLVRVSAPAPLFVSAAPPEIAAPPIE
jgi:hypothetical protein